MCRLKNKDSDIELDAKTFCLYIIVHDISLCQSSIEALASVVYKIVVFARNV